MLGLLRIGYQLLSLSCIRYCVLGITSLGHRPYALNATSRATAGGGYCWCVVCMCVWCTVSGGRGMLVSVLIVYM